MLSPASQVAAPTTRSGKAPEGSPEETEKEKAQKNNQVQDALDDEGSQNAHYRRSKLLAKAEYAKGVTGPKRHDVVDGNAGEKRPDAGRKG